jgi:fumarate reductase subunit C
MSRRPYKRPMGRWWQRDPFFVRYMWREATALAVLVYALLLLAGLWHLGQGEAAWTAWLAWLNSPLALALHALLLAGLVFHAITWMQVLPKTLPLLFAGGKRVPDATIVAWGFAAALGANAALLALGWWLLS